jgi:hypothetical protein
MRLLAMGSRGDGRCGRGDRQSSLRGNQKTELRGRTNLPTPDAGSFGNVLRLVDHHPVHTCSSTTAVGSVFRSAASRSA